MAKSKMNKFSLSNYSIRIVFPKINGDAAGSIEYPDSGNIRNFPMVEIGGEGDYIGSASVARSTNIWTKETDATGAYVFNQNLDRSGEVSVDIKQVSDKVLNLYYYSTSIYENTNLQGGAYISIQRNGETIVECEDCFIEKVPNLPFQAAAQNLSWRFLSGRITYSNNFVVPSDETI